MAARNKSTPSLGNYGSNIRIKTNAVLKNMFNFHFPHGEYYGQIIQDF